MVQAYTISEKRGSTVMGARQSSTETEALFLLLELPACKYS
jgi:hypothetical protein